LIEVVPDDEFGIRTNRKTMITCQRYRDNGDMADDPAVTTS